MRSLGGAERSTSVRPGNAGKRKEGLIFIILELRAFYRVHKKGKPFRYLGAAIVFSLISDHY